MSDDLWADPCTSYCEDGIEYACGTPRDLALQIKQKDATIDKLRDQLDASIMVGLHGRRIVEAIDNAERTYLALCEGIRIYFNKSDMNLFMDDIDSLRELVCKKEISPNYPLDTQE